MILQEVGRGWCMYTIHHNHILYYLKTSMMMMKIYTLLILPALTGSFVLLPLNSRVSRNNNNNNNNNNKNADHHPCLLLYASAATKLLPTDASRIKKAGGGLAIVESGSLFFDPSIEGKTGGTLDRIQQGHAYLPAKQQPTTAAILEETLQEDAQHWLEDIGLPLNFAKPTQPVTATVIGRVKLISDDAPGDIQHVVLKLPDNMHYVEGQSLSVIPSGTTMDGNNKPHKPRLYSIASTRYGDLLDGRTVSLCVRRAQYFDPVTGLEDPEKKGVCSNFLCDSQIGDKISVAGPVGKTMLLPKDSSKDIIMVATGTGIAPYRGFLHRLFMENTVARHMFTGKAWLVLGVPVTGGLLYPDELKTMQANAQGNLEVTYAISREMKNSKGGKLYVQDVLAERADELLQRLDDGAVIYFCGLKGMMPGILEALERVASDRGIDWNARMKELKANEQWHVEVY
jgi:ferredoxin--NADP+ reductase